MEEAKRFNAGKNRLDLVPASMIEEVGKILTFGADKYGDNNWKKGMKWTKCIASLKRHLLEFEKGVDFDEESQELHISHILTNAAFLLEYYKIAPQFDDRPHTYLNRPKIGLDIDEVICNWVEGWCKKHNYPIPYNWRFSYDNKRHFEELHTSGELEEFYLNLPKKMEPEDIPFEPHCYITARSIDPEITKQWLVNNGFPTAPVYSVGFGQSKVDVAREAGVEIFVDDSFDNFVEMNNAGICTFLWDAKHNQRYNVGAKRIKNLKEII